MVKLGVIALCGDPELKTLKSKQNWPQAPIFAFQSPRYFASVVHAAEAPDRSVSFKYVSVGVMPPESVVGVTVIFGADAHGPQPSIPESNLLQKPPVCAAADPSDRPIKKVMLTRSLRGMTCSIREALGWAVFVI